MPYGVATNARSIFSNKLKHINHEFFHRPRMAQTLLENKERVKELKNTVAYKDTFFKKLDKIEEDFIVVNDVDKEHVDDPDGAATRVVRFLNKPGQYLPSFLNLFAKGASLSSAYLSSVIFLVQNIRPKFQIYGKNNQLKI